MSHLLEYVPVKGVNEIVWGRYIYLLTGVEAIVFTAVGFIFGREVNRARAENAEKDKTTAQEIVLMTNKKAELDKAAAQQKAQLALDKAKEEEMKGKNLAKQILNKIDKPPSATGSITVRSISAGNEKNELLDLALFVQKEYPDVDW